MSVWVHICGNERHLVNQVLKQMLLEITQKSLKLYLIISLSIYIYINRVGMKESYMMLYTE